MKRAATTCVTLALGWAAVTSTGGAAAPAPPAGPPPARADATTPPGPAGSPAAPAPEAGGHARVDAAPLAITEWPLAWSERRAALTMAYRRQHEAADAADLTIDPRVIVLHYTGGGSAKATKRYFDRTLIEGGRKQLAAAGKVNVSAHFLVDRDGTIYRLQPETRFARHCIGLNHIAIGIENVGDGRRYPLTQAQIAADAALVRDLAARFAITHLLGHYEVMSFRDHAYFRERDPAYRNSKPDPGAGFLAAVRAAVADLALAGLDAAAP